MSLSDLAVQQTNDDASMQKLSAVRRGYYADPYLALFVSSSPSLLQLPASARPSRSRLRPPAAAGHPSSPLIHRGYYIRVLAFRNAVRDFCKAHGPSAQILSLGAGYDTLYWAVVRDEHLCVSRYVEVDFPEVVQKKWSALGAHRDVFGASDDSRGEDAYVLGGCDLRDTAHLSAFLRSHLNPRLPTLILSECVLVYLGGREIEDVLCTLTRFFAVQASIMIYEQILPDDAFGRVMIENLERRGCALKGIHNAPDKRAQSERLSRCGFCQHIRVQDMNEVELEVLDPADARRINCIEPLDEVEEYRLLLSHYCIARGSTSPQVPPGQTPS